MTLHDHSDRKAANFGDARRLNGACWGVNEEACKRARLGARGDTGLNEGTTWHRKELTCLRNVQTLQRARMCLAEMVMGLTSALTTAAEGWFQGSERMPNAGTELDTQCESQANKFPHGRDVCCSLVAAWCATSRHALQRGLSRLPPYQALPRR